jgi:ubiquinone biosynthesis protein UbiJ
MAATPAWLAAAEALLNRGVGASMRATALARRLDGTAMRVDIEGWAAVRVSVSGGRMALIAAGSPLDTESYGPVGATITGSPVALLRLAGAPGGRGAGAVIGGDAELANSYRELLALARPDVEEELSRLVGDVPARRVSQLALRALEWARQVRRTAGENIAEYLQEESRDLVNKTELDEFLQAVDVLRETADRIEARITRLERRMAGAA